MIEEFEGRGPSVTFDIMVLGIISALLISGIVAVDLVFDWL